MKVQLVVVLQVLALTWCSQDTGYPAGMMSDCPGMNRTTKLSEDTRKSLFVLVKWPEDKFFTPNEKKCKLSAGGAACAAKYLNFQKRRTVLVISGYMDATFSPFVRMTYQAYLERGYNAIVVEIFPIFVRSYPVAARVTRPLGTLVGEFLAELTHLGLSSKHLEIVGGSLGAHTASYASERYLELTGLKPYRLTGLDPAGPCFRNLHPLDRFNAHAAERVDAVHTNIDGFGIADTVAQVDFYVNGGEYQQNIIGDFILPCFQFCSHVRSAAYWYFAYLHKDEFIAIKCDSVAKARHGDCYSEDLQTNLFGPKTNFSLPGIYYLPTRENMPYYMGLDGLKQRQYIMNDYLLRSAPDEDMVV